MSLLFCLFSVSSSSFAFSTNAFRCFHSELELIRIWIETCRHMKKGKYYLNWGIKNPELSFVFRVLSLFLKGTCTLLLGQSCVLLPPLYLAMDLSYLFILSGQELNCSGFI